MPRTTSGRVYKRGKFFWADYQIKGQRFRHRLEDKDGNPVTSKQAANDALTRCVAPAQAKTRQERAELAATALMLENTKLEKAETTLADYEKRKKYVLDKVWENWPYNTTSKGDVRILPERAVEQNKANWQEFTGWLTSKGITNLMDATAKHGTGYRDYLVANYAPNTVNRKIVILKCMFKRIGLDTIRDLKHVSTKGAVASRETLAPEVIRRAIDAAQGEYKLLLQIGLYTGLRMGDCATLAWESIDIGKREITLETAKTGTLVSLEVAAPLLDELSLTPPNQRKGYILPGMAELYTGGRQAFLSKAMSKLLNQAGGLGKEKRPIGRRTSRNGFHALRTTFVTTCAQSGIPRQDISRWIGHASLEVTRIYDRVSKNPSSKAITAALTGMMDTEARMRSECKNRILDAISQQLDGLALEQLEKLAGKTHCLYLPMAD